ncbi:diphosphomevalonate decarboxylase [candidate division KSB1 bacterium]|nr:diphosphomevalonate decarboxylase [candidate division KSB1 bacterium]
MIKGRVRLSSAKVTAFAPANIALCKYWGKRNTELNLPVTSSLSISMGRLGTETTLSLNENRDVFYLNGVQTDQDSVFSKRTTEYLDLFRPDNSFFSVDTKNNIPTAAGLASSASGFAALAGVLNRLFKMELDKKELSVLARLGSGSACRSVYDGFVEWHAGARDDGMDSYAESLKAAWPELRIGIMTVSEKQKPKGSREAMAQTVKTSFFYRNWPDRVIHDLTAIKEAINGRNFELLGETSESNALAMHAAMIESSPAIFYWLPETIRIFHRVWELRQKLVPVYFTIDAGPNVKLLFLQGIENRIIKEFPDLQIVKPFESENV